MAATQQLGVVPGGTLKVLVRDPPEALLVFGEHHPAAPRASVEPCCLASQQPRSAQFATLASASVNSLIGLLSRPVVAFPADLLRLSIGHDSNWFTRSYIAYVSSLITHSSTDSNIVPSAT